MKEYKEVDLGELYIHLAEAHVPRHPITIPASELYDTLISKGTSKSIA